MTGAELFKVVFADYQFHIFSVLVACMVLWYRMDKRHSNEAIKNTMKFEHVDKDIKEIKGDVKEIRKEVRDGKIDTDQKVIEVVKKAEIKIEEKYGYIIDGGKKEKKETA